MNYFKEKKNQYDNYTQFRYTEMLTENTGISHSIYFHKADYKIGSSVLYSKMPVKIEHSNGMTITTGSPFDGTLTILEAMPRYNYKKLLLLVENIDKTL